MKRKIKIANKRRFLVFLSILCAVFIIIISGATKLNRVYSSKTGEFIEITIVPGDTLWEIAKRNNPYNQDIRKIVYEIMKLNNMKSASLKSGSTIKIPTY